MQLINAAIGSKLTIAGVEYTVTNKNLCTIELDNTTWLPVEYSVDDVTYPEEENEL